MGNARTGKDDFLQGKMKELVRPNAQQFFRTIDLTKNMGNRDDGSVHNHLEIKDSLFTIPVSQIRRYTWGNLDAANTYIAVYTHEVVKLFPFGKSELQELLKTLYDLTGLKPTTIGAHVEHGAKQMLEDVRLRILDENILGAKSRWIKHTEELLRVLKDLTKDDAPINMVEMEWLYHSCRNNKAVIQESLTILKELWISSKTQDTMMKILTIVNRFLDGDILKGDDEILSDLLLWLHSIETALDPYMNATPLKLLLKVCHRAETLQTQSVVPLVEALYDETFFDLRHDFNAYIDYHGT